MNNTVKGLLIFVAGACTGSIVTLFVCRREMRNLVAELEELYEGVEEEPPMPEKEIVSDPIRIFDGNGNDIAEEAIDNMKKMIDLYLDKKTVEYSKADVENAEMAYHIYRNAIDNPLTIVDFDPRATPYIITVEDFNERFDNHDKLELTYYDGDGTLVDEGEELIADFVALIGDGTLERFGEGSEDPDIVYVRNEKLGVDYEVTRVAGSYKQMVLNDGGDD